MNRTIHYCNVNNEARQWPQNVVLGFGNSLTNQPLQKVKGGREKFRAIVKRQGQSKEELVKSLNELLMDREKYWPDDELHRRAPNWSNQLCSICARVPSAAYGSRHVHWKTLMRRIWLNSIFVLSLERERSFWSMVIIRWTFMKRQWPQLTQTKANGHGLTFKRNFENIQEIYVFN